MLSIIRPDIFNNFKSFGNRYCDPKISNWGNHQIDYTGSSNEKELNFILNHNIMIRRLKVDVLDELPKKIRQKINVELD